MTSSIFVYDSLPDPAVINHEFGEMTEIYTPEELDIDLSGMLYKDFQCEVSGLPEHYIAVAINYNDEESLNMAIDYFQKKF